MDWEIRFIIWANSWWKWSPFDLILPWLTYLGSHIAVIIFIILFFILKKNISFLKQILMLYAIQSSIVYCLKYLIQRERPFHFLQLPLIGSGEILDPSFPSAHATYVFMMATILSYWFPRYRPLFIIIATFICWTRVYLYLHYPTDVIAGALLGYIITRIYLRKRRVI